jgi:oligopeptide transport system permease protein
MEDKYHLNDPMLVQLYYFVKGVVTELDFGESIKLKPGRPVFDLIVSRIPPTVALNVFSLIISIPLGLIAGTAAALKRNTWIDTLISFAIVLLISIPSFVFASLLQYSLTFVWPVFPPLYISDGTLGQMAWSMILPIFALALGPIATIGRYLRGELIENISSDYILLARTKGLSRPQAIVRHAFRNSMMPITSTLVSLITGIMGGSLVVESMFAIPGTGGMLVKSIFAGDHFLTVAILIFYSAISLVTILVVDLSYSLIDPRVRVGGGK